MRESSPRLNLVFIFKIITVFISMADFESTTVLLCRKTRFE